MHMENKATYIKEEMHDHIFFLNHFWFSSTHSFFAECYLRLVFLSVGETRGGGVTAGARERRAVCVTLTLIKHRKNSHLGDCVQPGKGGEEGG